jgi:Tfp pilus assembly protein PilF
MDQFELETAFQHVKKALDIDPKHVEALEMMASIQMEMGNVDSAKNISFFLIEIFSTFL